MAANDGRVSADAGAFADRRAAKFVLAADEGARIVDIGENARWPAKYTVGKLDAGIERNVVLHLAAVADFDVRTDHDVLSEDAILADGDLGQNVHEVPDSGAGPDGDIVIDIGRFMNGHAGEARILSHLAFRIGHGSSLDVTLHERMALPGRHDRRGAESRHHLDARGGHPEA